MGIGLPIFQGVLAVVAILAGIQSGVNPLMVIAWATAGIVLASELLWTRIPQTRFWPWWGKLSVCVIFAGAIYSVSYLGYLRPNVIFEARNADPFIRPAMDGSLWIRVRAYNRGWAWTEVLCRFFLNDLRLDGEKPIIAEESLQLEPGGGELLPSSLEIPVPSGEGRYVNLAYIKKGANTLTIQAPQFQYEHDPDLPPGTYRFIVSASGLGCHATQTQITVKYNGGRDIQAFQTP